MTAIQPQGSGCSLVILVWGNWLAKLLGKNCQPFITSLGCTVPYSLKKKQVTNPSKTSLLLRCKQNSFPIYFFWNHISNCINLFIVSTARFGYGPTCSVAFCIIYNSILMYCFQWKKKFKKNQWHMWVPLYRWTKKEENKTLHHFHTLSLHLQLGSRLPLLFVNVRVTVHLHPVIRFYCGNKARSKY